MAGVADDALTEPTPPPEALRVATTEAMAGDLLTVDPSYPVVTLTLHADGSPRIVSSHGRDEAVSLVGMALYVLTGQVPS